MQKGNFVGVVAPLEWNAIQAAAQLKVTWDDTPKLPGQRQPRRRRCAIRRTSQATHVAVNVGNVDAGDRRRGEDRLGELLHRRTSRTAPLGPNCSIADVARDRAHGPLHGAGPVHRRAPAIASALGLPATAVRIEVYPGSGTYGHSTYDDVSISAALMSQAVGKPVRVQFMRWDEHGWDQFGPAQATDVRAGIDANGNIVAYDYTAYNHGWTQVVESAAAARRHHRSRAAPAGQVDTVSVGLVLQDRRTGGSPSKVVNGYAGFLKGIWLRAPGAPQATLRLRADDRRARARGRTWTRSPSGSRTSTRPRRTASAAGSPCSNAVAKAANWQPKVVGLQARQRQHRQGPRRRDRRLRQLLSRRSIADITVNKKTGKITVDHLYAAQDAGTTVNPASVENQMEGCLVQGTQPGPDRGGRASRRSARRASTGSPTRRSASRTRRR